MKAKHRISEEINLAVIIMTIIISITIVISLMLQRRFPAESWLFLQVKADSMCNLVICSIVRFECVWKYICIEYTCKCVIIINIVGGGLSGFSLI